MLAMKSPRNNGLLIGARNLIGAGVRHIYWNGLNLKLVLMLEICSVSHRMLAQFTLAVAQPHSLDP